MSLTTNALSTLIGRYEDVVSAAERLRGVAHRTPVLTSSTVDERTGARVFFKCENFQRGGAFKFRGAYNALSRLSAAQRASGVLTYSSGNHAQAVALAGRLLDVRVTIVMPADAPAVKLEATRAYGGEVVTYDRATGPTREEIGARLAAERGLLVIPPYDHPDVVAGQGTAAVELIEEVGPARSAARAVRRRRASLRMRRSPRGPWRRPAGWSAWSRRGRTTPRGRSGPGSSTRVSNPDTIADGARTPSLGKLTFPLVLQYVDDMVTVSEDAIVSATLLLWNRLKVVVEPTGALAAAALLEGVVPARGLRVGVILSGGNVDFDLVLARSRA